MTELDPEDLKLVTLSRGAQLRAYAPHTGEAEGAAVRDTDGRTYAAATVENVDPSLTTSALRGAVAAAVSSGIRTFEAAVVMVAAGRTHDTVATVRPEDVAVLAEFGSGVPLLLVGPDGVVHQTLTT